MHRVPFMAAVAPLITLTVALTVLPATPVTAAGGVQRWSATAVGSPVAGAVEEVRLREAADRAGVLLGTALDTHHLDDPAYLELVAGQANAITFENATKWGALRPHPDVFDFSAADRIADFAAANDLLLRGHTLIWHVDNPDWLESAALSRGRALALLREHIHTVVGHFRDRYPGRVVHWDVVNEVVANDGRLRRNVWQRVIGDDYVAHAFRFAHQADPRARLYLNDFVDAGQMALSEAAVVLNPAFADYPAPSPGAAGPLPCEVIPKCRGIQRLVSGLVAQGVPIHGVGFQAHIPNPVPADYRALTGWVGELGLEWAITELDVPVPTGTGSTAVARLHQARTYRTVADACVNDPACDTIVTWGLSDRYSWWDDLSRGLAGTALHFDQDLVPKPAAMALQEALQGGP